MEFVAEKETKKPFPDSWRLAERIRQHAFDAGLIVLGGVPGLIDGISGDHIELAPPYIMEDEHMEIIVEVLQESLSTILAQGSPPA
jgi:hypothetical protein